MEKFVEAINLELKEKYPTAEICFEDVNKANDIRLIGVSVRFPNVICAPIIYLNDYAKEYEDGKSLKLIAEEIYKIIEQNNVSFSEKQLSVEHVLKNLRLKVVNTKLNEEYLKNKIHFEILDMSFLYTVFVKSDDIGVGSYDLSYELLNKIGLDESMLYQEVERNMVESYEFCSLFEIIKEKFGFQCDEIESEIDNGMFVLTNSENFYGAATVAIKPILSEIAKKFNSNFFVLPSSRHETIILKCAKTLNPIDLKEMVKSVNEQEVSEHDFLSDNVYMFLKEENTLMYA